MKIAVISSYACIYTSNNYGALLQYYALQEYLKRRGHEVFWIRSIIPQSVIRIFMRHIKNYRNIRLLKGYYDCNRTFVDFISKYLNVSSEVYRGMPDLIQRVPEADYYITGSDQVWGGELKENYLLFVPDSSKKIAYAASFGRDNTDQQQMRVIAPWIKDIPHVSVREKSGVEICRKIGVTAEHLIDPTLLIDAQDYPIVTNGKIDRIFCYFINVTSKEELFLDSIREFAHEENLKFTIASCQYSERFFDRQELLMPSPQEWLSNYQKAKYVVTNTFHGTVFAIIFRKQFATILQSGSTSSQNTRILSLLKMFGLENRIATTDIIDKVLRNRIDWTFINSLIEEYRKKTDKFFQNTGI